MRFADSTPGVAIRTPSAVVRHLSVALLLVALSVTHEARAAENAELSPFGAGVDEFSPRMPLEQIPKAVDRIAAAQIDSHFGANRYAILFAPGTYDPRTSHVPIQPFGSRCFATSVALRAPSVPTLRGHSAFRDGEHRTYVSYNAGVTRQPVHFADGESLTVEPGTFGILNCPDRGRCLPLSSRTAR